MSLRLVKSPDAPNSTNAQAPAAFSANPRSFSGLVSLVMRAMFLRSGRP